MKTLSLIAALLMMSMPDPVAAAEFFSAIEDLPLMQGLVEDTGGAMSFDSPTGRIVEVFAGGAVSREVVQGFYDETLPQLGWVPVDEQVFEREGETLKIEYPPSAQGTNVRFTLSPTP